MRDFLPSDKLEKNSLIPKRVVNRTKSDSKTKIGQRTYLRRWIFQPQGTKCLIRWRKNLRRCPYGSRIAK